MRKLTVVALAALLGVSSILAQSRFTPPGLSATGTNTIKGYFNFSGGRLRLPEATFANPPSSPLAGQVWLFTDASAQGTCSGGGSATSVCRWTGTAWSASLGGGTTISGAPTTWPTFATVATSGSYTDLLNTPTIPSAFSLPAFTGDCTSTAGQTALTCTKSSGTAFGSAAFLSAGYFQTAISGAPSAWPTTWPWTSLSGVPSFGTAAFQNTSYFQAAISGAPSTWPATWSWASLSGVPTFATVATSGSYNDLLNKPTTPSPYSLPATSTDTSTPATPPSSGSTIYYTKGGVLCSLNPSGVENCVGGVTVPLVLTPTLATSYSNPGGSGSRTGMISVTGYTGDVCGNGLGSMIPGNNQNCLLPLEGGDTGGVTGTAVNTGGYLTFSFGFARKITEFTFVFIESTTATFEFRGSNDNVNWTVLTPASALASGPTVFSAASNTTNYLYYQLYVASGGAVPWSNSSTTYCINFKIDSYPYQSLTFSTGGLQQNTGTVNNSGAVHTLPVAVGLTAAKPSTCTVGELYFATDAATPGKNLCFCTAANTWTAAP